RVLARHLAIRTAVEMPTHGPRPALVVGHCRDQRIATTLEIVVDHDPVAVAQAHDLEARARVEDVAVARVGPRLAIVVRLADQRALGRRTVVAQVGDERAVVPAHHRWLHAAEAYDR